VLRPGGTLLYSDFHFEATRAGHARSFHDESGRRFELPLDGYPVATHRFAAGAAGFEIETLHELRAGIELNEPFTGSEQFYARWAGVPIVLVVRARKQS
jgi:malonyl-CoA O-methyltransferase